MVTNQELAEKTAPANGANPEAVAEAAAHALQQAVDKDLLVKESSWTQVNKTTAVYSAMGQLMLKADIEAMIRGNLGKKIAVKAGTQVRPIMRSPGAHWFMGMIIGPSAKPTELYVYPTSAVQYPASDVGSAPRAASAPRVVVKDELYDAMLAAVNKVGRMPSGKDAPSSKSKTAEEWRKDFPNCTIENIAAALLAIQAFRADRASRLAEAVKAGKTDEMKKWEREYRLAKSHEQDVFSTATNCQTLK